jgi:hypothetical protein
VVALAHCLWASRGTQGSGALPGTGAAVQQAAAGLLIAEGAQSAELGPRAWRLQLEALRQSQLQLLVASQQLLQLLVPRLALLRRAMLQPDRLEGQLLQFLASGAVVTQA